MTHMCESLDLLKGERPQICMRTFAKQGQEPESCGQGCNADKRLVYCRRWCPWKPVCKQGEGCLSERTADSAGPLSQTAVLHRQSEMVAVVRD